MLGEQHQPLGDHRPYARHRALDRPGQRLVRAHLADHQQAGGRHDRPRHQAEDAVRALPQLGPHQREAPGLGRDLVGVAVGPHLVGAVPAPPGGDEAAREHPGVRPLVERHRFAGEQRLVHLEGVGGQHRAVGHDLGALGQLDHVVGDHLVDGHLPALAVPRHLHRRGGQQGQPVEGALRPPLLVDADAGVGHQHDAEQRVLDGSHRQDHHEQPAQDGVEPGEDVGPDDGPQRAAGAPGRPVHPPVGHALVHLGAGQPAWKLCREWGSAHGRQATDPAGTGGGRPV